MYIELRPKRDLESMDRKYGMKLNEIEKRFEIEIKVRGELAEAKMQEIELRHKIGMLYWWKIG